MSKFDRDKTYADLMDHLERLQPYVLITTGRTGTDFFQSLLDSHTEVLTFNGQIYFHNFWNNSKCTKINNIIISDALDEFIGMHIEKFKSKYDVVENKDSLGENSDQSLDIDLILFKNEATKLLQGRQINSRNFMLAVYGAYAICLNQNLLKMKLVLHHLHNAELLTSYINDFPDSKIICMTRDPRANFVSGVIHWRNNDKNSDCGRHLYYYIRRIIIDAYSVDKYDNDYIVIRLEDLGNKSILQALCGWLNIKYEETLERSTWGGLRWRGDYLSSQKNTKIGWSAKMIKNSWQTKLSSLNKYLFNFLLNDRLIHYKYQHGRIHFHDYLIVPFIILIPLSFEMRFFSWNYINNSLKVKNYTIFLKNLSNYIKRVLFFYQVFFKRISGFRFSRKFINCD
jgi:hypothetical protein